MLRLLFGGRGACASASWGALWQHFQRHRVRHRDLGHVTLVVWWGGRLRHSKLGCIMAAFLGGIACATATWDMLCLLFGKVCTIASWDAFCLQFLGCRVRHRDLGHATFVVWWGGRLRHINFRPIMLSFSGALRAPPRLGTCYDCCLVGRGMIVYCLCK